MIINVHKLDTSEQISCDICIIGAGAAGITLALEMARTGRDIILLEAGGMNRSGDSLRLYEGEVVDTERHLPLDADRYRQLGGTTSLWGGRCLPLDNIDFAHRDYVPDSGWPVTANDMEPYYRRAHIYCECGEYAYRKSEALPDGQDSMIPGFHSDDVLIDTLERWSPPTNFGKRYRDSLQQAPNVRAILNAVCVNIDLADDGDRVTRLQVRKLNGDRFQITPGTVILSGGGLEVTRLLLASKHAAHPAGIGNHSDWLGRSYMCHINGSIARVQFNENVHVSCGYEMSRDGIYCRRRLTISESAQLRNRLLNLYMLLDRPTIGDPAHGSGLLSLAHLAKLFAHGAREVLPAKGKYALYWRHLLNVIAGSGEVLTVLPKWARNRFLQGRRIPSLLVKPKDNTYSIYYHTEQAPNRESRVLLSDKCDMFGMPRLIVDYQTTETDADSVVRAHTLLDQALRQSDSGKLIFENDDPSRLVQHHAAVLGHHIGTTRMSATADNGVVDEHCKVYGLENLYVASSSVFPTSSQANPTLTIVALAIRLADHLKQNGHLSRMENLND